MEFEVFDGMQNVSFLSLSEIHLCKKINLRDWKVVGQYFHGIKFIFCLHKTCTFPKLFVLIPRTLNVSSFCCLYSFSPQHHPIDMTFYPKSSKRTSFWVSVFYAFDNYNLFQQSLSIYKIITLCKKNFLTSNKFCKIWIVTLYDTWTTLK